MSYDSCPVLHTKSTLKSNAFPHPNVRETLKNIVFSSFSTLWVLLHGSRALPHGVPAPVPPRASPGNLPGVPHPYPLHLKSNDLGILWGLPGSPPQCLLSFKSGDLGLLWVRLGTCRPSYVVTSANHRKLEQGLGAPIHIKMPSPLTKSVRGALEG